MQGSGQLCWGRAGRAHPGSDSHGCTRLPCPQVGWGHLAGEGPVMLCSDPAAQILPTRVSLQPHVRDLRVRAGAGGWERYPWSSRPADLPPLEPTPAGPGHLLTCSDNSAFQLHSELIFLWKPFKGNFAWKHKPSRQFTLLSFWWWATWECRVPAFPAPLSRHSGP